jgi:hypothetical protein
MTRSKAMIRRGMLESVESTLLMGICGLQRTKNCQNPSPEIQEETQRELEIMETFCTVFTKVVTAEDQHKEKTLEKWLLTNPKRKDKNPRLEAYLDVHVAYPTSAARKTREADYQFLLQIIKKAKKRQARTVDIERAIQLMNKLSQEAQNRIEPEKRELDQIIRGWPSI